MLHDQMRGGIRTKLSHLSAGLAKLEEASATVDSLSNNAEVEQAKLVEAQKGADAAMEMITKTLSEATGRRGEVNDLKTEVTRREEHTISRQGEIKQELSSIQPVLETAKAAVGQIKAEHLNEIRSLKMPPEPIADVLGAVLKLLGISDVSWTSMKKFLGNRGVKDEILNYDARRIGGEMRKDVARLLKQKSTSFDQATITRVSVAAAPLAAWVKANIRYSVVLEKIQPLEAELARAEEDLAKCTLRLRQCEDEIATIDDRVAALKAEFGDKTREAEKLRARLALAEGTLDKAQHLLGKLSGEQARWQTQAGDLRSELASLPRQLLVAAGFLTYLSRCPEDAREAALADWTATVGLAAFDFTSLLATESRLLAWKQVGLPADPLSMENALVVAHNPGARVPFVIDPADAARAWLVAHYGGDDGRPLEVLQSADARFGTTVELAVRFGKTLLIFDVDARSGQRRRAARARAAADAARRARARALPARARRDLAMNGPARRRRVGDRTVDFHENFRLALVTRNPTPDLPPDAAALCTLVNFTVTRSGLEGQLLGATIQHEEPELETKKTAMLKQEEDYKIKLAGLETDLLEALATAEGDLLENALLIESLTRTKEASREISDALAASAEASATLDARAARRTAASRATAAGSTSSSATSSS
ncbi:dynein light chain binding protein [Aureococcus anophagefferens]|uniref:Dynein light chain binding protein n=1 Tax=Aureococcus anophagefferens TaxID=44056 RepID=A0ABR1G7W1_AURAN